MLTAFLKDSQRKAELIRLCLEPDISSMMIALLSGLPGTAQFRASRTTPYPRPTLTQYLLGTPLGLPAEQLLHQTPPGCVTPAKVFHGGKRNTHISVLPAYREKMFRL